MKAVIGPGLSVDVETLIGTRMLIQANSGGGKSWAIRKLVEATHGHVHQIVLDMEGEFASLRAKYDFVLAGKGGDVAAHPAHAAMLARKLLELRADAIIDLYELHSHERVRFVKLFLDAMTDAPKELWHPVIVVVDEAHVFAPEKGSAESLGAVLDLATRGRKRGFCAVLATQRLSKLHKDAAAECNNKLIGRTGLDVDLRRVADELGMTARDAIGLRDLEPGEFYAFGPAISRKVLKIMVGPVQTKHPTAGHRGSVHAPAPGAKIKAVLSRLADLPREAEEERQDRESLRARVRDLERQIRQRPAAVAPAKPMPPDPRLLSAERERGFQKGWADGVAAASGAARSVKAPTMKALPATPVPPPPRPAPAPARTAEPATAEGQVPLGKCERSILGFLKAKEGEAFSLVQIGAMTTYSPGGGGFLNAISRLSRDGLIDRASDGRCRLADGADLTGISLGVPCLLSDWIAKLPKCERAIYDVALKEPGRSFSREEMGEATGYKPSGGGFLNAISALNTLGLIRRHRDGKVELNPDVSGL